jgi:hypothetical protein
MHRNVADQYLEILQRSWNEREGILEVELMCKFLGSGSPECVGYLLAEVLASDLRGWQASAAKELRSIVAQHSDPPEAWLQRLWDFTHAAITSDPDEMMHLFTLIQSARSDTVRNWIAEPLVALSERKSDVHRWLGFQGLECLILSGGSVHLRPFFSRLAALANSIETPRFRQAARRLLELGCNQLQKTTGLSRCASTQAEKGFANLKVLPTPLAINQSLDPANNYTVIITNKPKLYAA